MVIDSRDERSVISAENAKQAKLMMEKLAAEGIDAELLRETGSGVSASGVYKILTTQHDRAHDVLTSAGLLPVQWITLRVQLSETDSATLAGILGANGFKIKSVSAIEFTGDGKFSGLAILVSSHDWERANRMLADMGL